MKRILIIFIMLLFASCAHSPITTDEAIKICDKWWKSIRNEDSHYYEVIKFCNIDIHLCGSRAKLWVEHNKLYPHTPFDLSSDIYMFTSYNPNRNLIEMWLVIKIVDGKVILHKWATGHEFVRILSLYSQDLLRAEKY